ncbi:MAG: 3'-5' exonuclease [bacterium]
MIYPSHIDKEQVIQLPPCSIVGQIKIIDKPSEVKDAVKELYKCSLIGFDTETKPSFKRGETNSISLLQLATEECAYLFRLKMIGENEDLKKLLEDKNKMKVGLSVSDDFRSLIQWMKCKPTNFIELQRYVKAFGIEEMGLQKIFAILFNERISKRQQLSNWEAVQLSPAQQQYAAIDAWACRNIYITLQNKVKEL